MASVSHNCVFIPILPRCMFIRRISRGPNARSCLINPRFIPIIRLWRVTNGICVPTIEHFIPIIAELRGTEVG